MKGITFFLLLVSFSVLHSQAVTLRDTTNQYDYIIITVPEFVNACIPFKQHKETIRSFILESINIPDLNDDDNLFETGIVNSLFAIQLMTFLEKSFSIEVTMDDLSMDNFQSVNATSLFVERKQNN